MTRKLRVTEIARTPVGGGVELTARVRGLPFPLRSYRLRFRFPPELAEAVDGRGDPFVPALLLPAMAVRRDLVIEAPVSPEVIDAAAWIARLVAGWFPHFRPGVLRAPCRETVEEQAQPRRVGSFFTGGVDSFHTVLDDQASNRPPEDRITDLLYVAGFDVPLGKRERGEGVVGLLHRAARDLRLPLAIVETNLRLLTDCFLGWANYFSGGLASVALALGRGFGRVHMSSHMPNVAIIPWGSHAIVYPRWSTAATRLTYDDSGLTRNDKMRATIIRSPVALEHLRVCWKNVGSGMNCGRCEKCLRTKLTLLGAGVLDRCATFDPDLDPALVDRLPYDSCVESCFPEILASLEAADAPTATIDAIKRLLARPAPSQADLSSARILDRYGEHRLHGVLRRLRGWVNLPQGVRWGSRPRNGAVSARCRKPAP